MNTVSKINKKHGIRRVLVIPLDWGLGHATRCIPIINELKERGVEVLIAGEGPSLQILVKALPGLVFLPLKGYRVTYAQNKLFFMVHMLAQTLKIRRSIKAEHTWLEQIIKEYEIDGVVSDNRYGLWNKSIPSVFLTHQLNIKTGNRFLNYLARKINWSLINKFSNCWLADVEGNNNLSGELAHPKIRPTFGYQFLGLLSRFTYQTPQKNGPVLFLISGPEPSRSHFEKKILQQVNHIKQPVILIRGLPHEKDFPLNLPANVQVYNHAEAEELCRMISSARMVVCRAGYSTLMDLAALKKHAIIVPTAGQTEQEYLAQYLHQQKLFMQVNEEDFNWETLQEKINAFSFSTHWPECRMNKKLIDEFIASLY